MRKLLLILMLACTALLGGRFAERGFYLGLNAFHMDAKKFAELESVANRLAKEKYTHVYLCSPSFFINCWEIGKRHHDNLTRIVDILRQRDLKVVVGVLGACDPCQYAFIDHKVCEALPVINEPYKVVGRQLVPQNMLGNGSFENGLRHWRLDQHIAAELVTDTVAEGTNALHIKVEKPQQAPGGMVRIWSEIACKPFQQYRLSFMLKTKNLTSKNYNCGINAAPLGKDPQQPDGFRYLSYRKPHPQIKPTQDWTRHTITFNTLEVSELLLALGSWKTKTGEFWLDDIQLKPASFLNALQREDTPISLTSQDGNITYQKGKDYPEIMDPGLGAWKVNDSHEPPVITLPETSAIPEGSVVYASYHHPAFALKGAFACPHSPVFRQAAVKQIDYFHRLIKPDGYLIVIDEQRAYGYDPACIKSGMTAGAGLRDLAIFTYNAIRKTDPKARIYMWDDMFNPYGNACFKGYQRYYYLIKGKGSLAESWVGLPKDIIMLMWQGVRPQQLRDMGKFYQDLGMEYVSFPRYFEAYQNYPEAIVGELLDILKEDRQCIGVGFAQWAGLFGNAHLEAFSKSVREAEERK